VDVAIAALGLAVLSLSWQVYSSFRAEPKLRVMRRTTYRIGGTRPTTHQVVVVNMGSHGTTVDDVGITLADGTQRSVKLLRDDGQVIDGPPLPARLDGHDSLTWDVPNNLLVPGAGLVSNYGWAQQYVRPRRWSKDALLKIGIRSHRSESVETTF
jgi:hypothetical protein